MPISYINGVRLEKIVVVAAQRLLDCQERIDKINVFPIPDGDTGTNMALTLKAVAESAINSGHRLRRLDAMSEHLAEAALMGSCGNSGAILAQFFDGMAEAFRNRSRIGLEDLACAMTSAVEMAEKAIAQPVEGTILTVMRAWAQFLEKESASTACIAELMRRSLEVAQKTLQDTPRRLKVLQKAGVVDAGAQGFVNMLEGVVDYIKTGELVWAPPLDAQTGAVAFSGTEMFQFRYCTECILEGESLDRGKIRDFATNFGDSLIVAGSTRKIRIHVHTNEPQELFEGLSKFGAVGRKKFDDMKEQYETRESARQIALIVDSSCDLPTDYIIKHQIRIVPVQVTFGTQTYLDRVNITGEEIYRMMREPGSSPKTSQPSQASFRQAFDLAGETHNKALALTLSSAVSGTWQACCKAAEQKRDMTIEVIDSSTTAGALGLLTMIAAEAIQAGKPLEEVSRLVKSSLGKSQLFAHLDDLTYLVRGGRISPFTGWLARTLRLMPIVTFGNDGRIQSVARTRPGRKGQKRLLDMTLKACENLKNPRFLVCHAAAEEAALFYQEELQKRFDQEHIPILPVSPTLGVHAGPGASGICFIGD